MTKKSPKPTKLSQGRKTSQGRASAAAASFRSANGAGQGAHNPADLEICAPPRADETPALPGSTHEKGLEIVTEEKRRVRGNLFPIVGIGASAGGFEAFTQFLNALAPDTGMAFVLVQHLDPKHKSRLTELLGYSSKMPVLEAKDDMEVEPNHIYVIPENANMTVAEGRLRLSPRKKTEMPPMPIDVFFRSLGHDQQNRAIGVVLSGTGSDGTLGVEAIKGEGGIVFAQSESSAKFFGMPGSAIASGSVDFVLPPADMARELGRIARHPYVGRTAKQTREATAAAEAVEVEKLLRESPDDLATLFGLLRLRTGVDFSFYKHSTLKRRILRRMVLHKVEKLGEYLQLVEANSGELDALFNDLLINVTSFFRDPHVFQVLKRNVFPRLVKNHREDTPLRFWVCGCATGEEVYSLAISMVEFFDQARSHRPVQIFGTDISEAGIEKARAAIYPENIQQDVSPERLRRFFTKVNGSYQMHKSIRDLCIFARQNVLVDPPFSNLDLVMCRNVLIYFGPLLQRKIIPVFHYALRSPGLLVLGSSETIGASSELFTLTDKKCKLYTKKPNYNRPAFDVGQRARELEAKQALAGTPLRGLKAQRGPPDLAEQVDKILLSEFSPAAVVVNSDLEVQQFRGATGSYLEHAPGSASLNLFKMAREGLVLDLRAALGRAAKHDSPVKQTGIRLRGRGSVREITLEVAPFRLGPSGERFFLVVFKEPEGAATEAGGDEKGLPRSKGALERREIARLKLELGATKESLQSIIEEQEATNEELKSANEEIQSSNEELQSTNEELETAKEELQSTNEELTTLNEELQTRNTELTQVNNDLTNLLSSVNVAILMLGTDLTIRRFTPLAERIFNLIPSDVGRRLSDLSRTILMPDLESTVRGVIDNLTTVEREVQEHDGRWYSLRIRPYRTHEHKIEGAVLVLVDIDQLRRALETVLETVRRPLVMLGPDLKVLHANEAFRAGFGLAVAEVRDKFIYEVGDGHFKVPEFRRLLEEVLPQNKQVDNYEVEATLPNGESRKMLLSARRFYEDGRGMQMLLLAFEEAVKER